MRYRCLILDHDDTAVDSTRAVHYPAYLEILAELRPKHRPVSFDGWMRKNFTPGIYAYLTEELGLDDGEMAREYEMWRSHAERTDPPFFEGMLGLLSRHREQGGVFAVVSHSEADMILRAYRAASGGAVLPDAIYGWEQPPERRKPSPWPVLDVIRRFNLQQQDVLVVDDLKPGVDMARTAGVAVAAAGWGYDIPPIRAEMEKLCDYYFETVGEFAEFVGCT